MHVRSSLDDAAPPAPGLMDRFRLHADPVVWSHVSSAMRRVEARDSIAFRTGGAGYGWKVAAWLLAIVVGVSRSRSRRAPRWTQ